MVYPGGGITVSRLVSGHLLGHSSTEIFSGRAALSRLLAALPASHPFHQRELSQLGGPLRSLAQESDPQLFYADLFSLAQSREESDPLFAQTVYQSLITEEAPLPAVPQGLGAQASHRLEVLSGGGGLGEQMERLAPHVLEEALAPEILLGMTAGSMAFRGLRAGAYGRLMALPRATWWNRGLGARSLATLIGFAAEAPTFTLSTHALRETFGNSTGSSLALTDQILSGYIMLGSLRAFGSVFQRMSLAWASGPGALDRFTRAALPQAGMALGLMASQGLEIGLGRRERGPWQGHVAELMATFLQFHMASRLAPPLLGRGYQNLEQQMEQSWQHPQGPASPYPETWGELWTRLPNLVSESSGPRWVTPEGMEIPANHMAMSNGNSSSQPPLPLNLPPASEPVSTRRPRSRATPVPAEATTEVPRPNGRGLLPKGDSQIEMLPVMEGQIEGSLDAAMRSDVAALLRRLHSANPQSVLHHLKPLLMRSAAAEGVSLDVFLGRTLKQANAAEVEAALTLLRHPTRPGDWSPEYDIQWILAHDLPGGIPRLGSLAGELGTTGARAREALIQMAPAHFSEVARTVETLLQTTESLALWKSLELAGQISHRGMIPVLRGHAYGKNPMAHRSARNALLQLEDSSLAGHFRRILETPRSDFAERAWAAYGLGRLGHVAEAEPALAELVQSSRAATRFEAARGLIRLRLQGHIPSTKQLVTGMDGRQLITLAQDFLEAGFHRNAIITLRQALQLPENGIQIQILDLISQHRLQALRPEVSQLRENQYPEHRWAAAQAEVALAAGRGDRDLLWQWLRFEEQVSGPEAGANRTRRGAAQRQIQLAAAQALADLPLNRPDRQALARHLRSVLQTPEDPRFLLDSALVLAGPLADSQGIAALKTLLRDPNPEIRAEAVRGLRDHSPNWDEGILATGRRIRFLLSEYGLHFEEPSGP